VRNSASGVAKSISPSRRGSRLADQIRGTTRSKASAAVRVLLTTHHCIYWHFDSGPRTPDQHYAPRFSLAADFPRPWPLTPDPRLRHRTPDAALRTRFTPLRLSPAHSPARTAPSTLLPFPCPSTPDPGPRTPDPLQAARNSPLLAPSLVPSSRLLTSGCPGGMGFTTNFTAGHGFKRQK
jgi:hypothetical protein